MQIAITGMGSCSAVGSSTKEILQNYTHPAEFSRLHRFGTEDLPVFPLSCEDALTELRQASRRFNALGRVSLMAMHASSLALDQSSWNSSEVAVILGSARSQTEKIEEYHTKFLNSTDKLSALTSPITTAGGIASAVANYLKLSGPHLSVSATCVSSLQAIAIGCAMLESAAASKVCAGGCEAALTPFTIAQMRALGIYSKDTATPCKPCIEEDERENRFVLGEGAAVFALQSLSSCTADQTCLAKIVGLGFASEPINSLTSISEDGAAFYKAMNLALAGRDPAQVDAIILHAPGTVAGDQAELNAISKLFGSKLPNLFSNKWLVGHTLGASGALSLEMALLLLNGMQPPALPYPTRFINQRRTIKTVLVNSAGFGGQAGAILVTATL